MFNNKKDPLVDAVKSIMEASAREREVERKLNESLGITSKKALPHELHKEYDAALLEAKKCMYEEGDEKELSPKQKKLAAKAGDKDEIEAVDLKKLRKDKSLDEAKATEAQKEKVAKVMRKWKKGEEHIGKSDKTVPVTKKGQKQAVAIALSQAGLSKKKKMDESVEAIHEEIRGAIMEKLNHIYENEGVEAANAYFETLSEEEKGILGEQGVLDGVVNSVKSWWNSTPSSKELGQRLRTANQPTQRPTPLNPAGSNIQSGGTQGIELNKTLSPVTSRTTPIPQTQSQGRSYMTGPGGIGNTDTKAATPTAGFTQGGSMPDGGETIAPTPAPTPATAPTPTTPATTITPAAPTPMARPAPTPRPARPAPTSDWKKDVFDSTKIGGA